MDLDDGNYQSPSSRRGRRRFEHLDGEDEHPFSSHKGKPLIHVGQPGKGGPDMSRSSQTLEHVSDTTRTARGRDDAELPAASFHHQRSHSMSPATAANNGCYREDYLPKGRSQGERAAEKAIGTAATAMFRVRNDPGSWFGEKGFKVATAAMLSASIDFVLGVDKKKHPFSNMVVSMIQGAVMDYILSDDSDDSD
ncbi:hypothetical protein EDB81DRAFT_760734 [Dactylonectria macrodidyma]|uniref:Uncharacterized protein n=1 Tax=Dactylonectria macrodidyma TaxID=307937 RepID=A0A9P9EQ44_9HYPO|nr:hypothetical protein EDB81DRAFT_760734 [Dactylonectria macrodidyma]